MSQDVRKALEAERQRLQALILRAKAKLDHLDALLEPDDVETVVEPAPAEVSSNGGAAKVGLRSAIFTVLNAHAGGLHVRDIAAQVPATGYRPSGQSTTRQLVYGEVSRLLRQNRIGRRGKKYFPVAGAS